MPLGRAWFLAIFLAIICAAPAAVAGQPAAGAGAWHVPIDITQGFTLNRGSPVPFTASARVQLARGFGETSRFRIGPSAALIYDNPDWEIAGGARVSLRAFSLNIPVLAHWGAYLQAEQLFGTADLAPASLAFLMDLGVLRFGVWGTHDWNREVQKIEASIGVGLDALIPLLRPSTPREPDFGMAGRFREVLQ